MATISTPNSEQMGNRSLRLGEITLPTISTPADPGGIGSYLGQRMAIDAVDRAWMIMTARVSGQVRHFDGQLATDRERTDGGVNLRGIADAIGGRMEGKSVLKAGELAIQLIQANERAAQNCLKLMT